MHVDDYLVETRPDCKDNIERCTECSVDMVKYNGQCLPRLSSISGPCPVVGNSFECLQDSACISGDIVDGILVRCLICNESQSLT